MAMSLKTQVMLRIGAVAEQIVIDRMMSETLGGATHNGRSGYHN